MAADSIISSFKSWKIYLAVFLALFFAGFLLWSALNETQFIRVSDNSGTHLWQDSNGNQKIDFSITKEFVENAKGNFRQKTNGELLSEIQWTSQAFLWLFFAVICMFGRDLAYMWRIRILCKNELTWKTSFKVILLWEFASALSPGVVGGSAVAMFILNKEKIPLGRSTGIVIITAFLDNLFYILMIPLLFIFVDAHDLFPQQGGFNQSVFYLFVFGFSVIFSICLLLYLGIFHFPHKIKHLLLFIFSLSFLKKWKHKVEKTGEEIELCSAEFKKEKKKFWVKAFSATFLSWFSRYMVINCILAAFLQLHLIDHLYIFGKQLVLWLFLLISPTPGASGVAEFAFKELMFNFSDSVFLLTSLAILWRLISYFPYLIIGPILLPRWLKNKK